MTAANSETTSLHCHADEAHYTLTTRAFGSASTFSILLCLIAANFFRIGCQLVTTAWSAVLITGRPESVGHVLLIASATNVVFSPFIGTLEDRALRKKPLVMAGQLGVAICGASPLVFAVALPHVAPFPSLVVATLLSSMSGIVLSCAMDYFVKLAVAPAERTRKLALLNTLSQSTLIAGTAFGGYLVSQLDWRSAFLVIGGCGLLLTVLSAALLPSLTCVRHARRNSRQLGPALYLTHRRLFSIACCSALAFAVGQVTNTLLAAFMSLDLKLSAQSYSIVEAAWSVGALAASAVLAKLAKNRLSPLHHDVFVVLIIAGLLSLVPRLSALGALATVHLMLGIGFAIVRVRAEARFLTECPTHLLARFRANSLLISGSISAVIFITPTLCRDLAAPALYQMLSGAIAVSALFLLAFARPWRLDRIVDGGGH
jgi:predicted MFS family arabinose efflux permease